MTSMTSMTSMHCDVCGYTTAECESVRDSAAHSENTGPLRHLRIVRNTMVWNAMGASVRGSTHRKIGCSKQGAWLSGQIRGATFVVVCDGLADSPHATIGSRSACYAVEDAVSHWTVSPGVSPELLISLVHSLWNVRVSQTGPAESATTCLFAVATTDGRLVIAQLGNGLVMMKTLHKDLALEPPPNDPGQPIAGLGVSQDVAKWSLHVEPIPTGRISVLLATNSVVQYLTRDQQESLMNDLVRKYEPRRAAARTRAIAKELREWPTPRHGDDKTLAMLWKSQ